MMGGRQPNGHGGRGTKKGTDGKGHEVQGRERQRERVKAGRNQRSEEEKRTKNELKFIRVQTDVNLFKLRDFDRGFIVAWRERLYLLYHCVGQGMGVDRS